MDFTAEREITCCFTGHRPEKLPWGEDEDSPACAALKRRMARTLEELLLRGWRHFLCGMAQGSDLYFAEAVLALRERYPQTVLEAVVPCLSQADRWSAAEQARYRGILDRCDMETLIQRSYDKYCMLRRNRYMVERSSVLLAVYDGQSGGGTRYTISHALDLGLEVVKLEP